MKNQQSNFLSSLVPFSLCMKNDTAFNFVVFDIHSIKRISWQGEVLWWKLAEVTGKSLMPFPSCFVEQYVAFPVVRFSFFFKFCHSYVLTIFLCPIFHRKCWFMLMKWPVYLIVCMFTLEQIHIFFFQVLHLFRMNTYINQIPAELRLSHFSMRNCKQQQWLQDNHCFVDLNALAIMMKYMWFSRVLDLRILNLVNDEHH